MHDFPAEFVDENNCLSISFFIMDDGNYRDFIAQSILDGDNAVPYQYLPHRVPVVIKDEQSTSKYLEILKNSRKPWMSWYIDNQYVYLFSDPVDAVFFRLSAKDDACL